MERTWLSQIFYILIWVRTITVKKIATEKTSTIFVPENTLRIETWFSITSSLNIDIPLQKWQGIEQPVDLDDMLEPTLNGNVEPRADGEESGGARLVWESDTLHSGAINSIAVYKNLVATASRLAFTKY